MTLRSPSRRVVAIVVGAALSIAGASPVAADGLTHTVIAGDTLSSIASAYSVTVRAIADLNAIPNPDVIFPGDVLRIPGLADERADTGDQYIVEQGDTLVGIAKRYGLTVADLQEANGLQDVNLIIVGQRLTIPGRTPTPDRLSLLPAEPPDDAALEALMDDMAVAEGVDAGVLKALAFVESGWDMGARSPAGAVGVMQLMPDTAAWLERDVFGQELNEDVSAYDNVKMGARLLHLLIDANAGDVDAALASYYQGQGATSAGIMYDETKDYVRLVRAVRDQYWP